MPIQHLNRYSATTRQIRVSVKPIYLDDQSAPADNHFVWAYQVKIENLGRETVQLRSRHWRIRDARGDVFEYTSGTPLPTPSGIMAGEYQMENERGEMFDIEIPAFSLDSPYQ